MTNRARGQTWSTTNPMLPPLSYYTNFPASENPISEGGKWSNGLVVATDWNNVLSTVGTSGVPNKACAATTVTGYADAIAILSGFPPDQSAEATVFLDSAYTPPDTHEIELLLRFNLGPNFARGYEVDIGFGGASTQVFCWHGTNGDVFPELTGTGPGVGSVATGDKIKAKIIGNVITVYKNGSLIYTVTDSQVATGNPGMGFFPRTGCDPTKYCISDFRASAE